MNPSSYCRTSIFEEELKLQNVRRDIRIHIATQNIILTFLSKWHFSWQSKYGSVTFGTEILFEPLACMH